MHAGADGQLRAAYPRAERMLILTATYGDGAAPASAKRFMARLRRCGQRPACPVAVLGFGDRQFPKFCRFARDVETALAREGLAVLMPLPPSTVSRAQDVRALGCRVVRGSWRSLALTQGRDPPAHQDAEAVARSDYGAAVQAPTAIFRFALPRRGRWRG